MRAWIEIVPHINVDWRAKVALRVRAWIEMVENLMQDFGWERRSPCESVD